MHIDRNEFSRFIKNSQFRELFIDLGWDDAKLDLPIAVDDQIFNLSAVAEKRGFTLFTCSPDADGKVPDSNSRKKIDRQITKRFFEHIIIFTNGEKSHQIWQSNIREPNKPIIVRETHYYTHQSPEMLYQKLLGLFFSLDEEEKIGLVDVRQRVTENFNKNTERVTKQFYDKFKKNHAAFLDFIQGISEKVDREWYASLMLNRLMFIYFIQKKGFLDNDPHYLRNRLRMTQEKKGRDKFYSFYRDFLLVLFHKGLGSPERSAELEQEIGQVPYLNGGLFDEHRLEKDNPELNIIDEAFERIFDFFDEYQWHLDTRVASSGKDINPDVIGYIFEKYINDRASMGAYYTKEDITDYISKNTIIPRLFDMVKKECSVAFGGESSLWNMLQENPDRYIYAAMQHGSRFGLPENWQGLTIDERLAAGLPEEIAVGIDTSTANLLERRKHWNKKAPQEVALPTEIYREVIERRKRYWEIYNKLANGDISDINDLITYNLDIRQFAQDAVSFYEGSDFINAMHKALSRITILDPTCGSGAFLFAALNILEPLYETCLMRMDEFVAADDLAGGRRFPQFRAVLQEMKNHPNAKYYIYKKIILQNLHGVDIMNEAVEIAKLRLFLKLVAELDHIDQVEPLPDIDFNIRAGNTLVGFATQKELHDAMHTKLDLDDMESIVHEKMGTVALAFKRYKQVQLSGQKQDDHAGYKAAKDELNNRLAELNENLNHYLARQYGIEPRNNKKYAGWKSSHKPFHWLAEFYEIIHANGGFDVIIGNPPYVEYSSVIKVYKIKNYKTEECGNLYPFIVERNTNLLSQNGSSGMIIPHSAFCTDRMSNLMNLFKNNHIWISYFDIRPGKLFVGVDQRLAIYIQSPIKGERLFSTKYLRWSEELRTSLFDTIRYNHFELSYPNSFAKSGNNIDNSIMGKVRQIRNLEFFLNGGSFFYFHNAPRYWIRAMTNAPYFWNEAKGDHLSSQVKELNCQPNIIKPIVAVLNSSLYYWFFVLFSDSRHLNMREIQKFGFDPNKLKQFPQQEINSIVESLMADYEQNKYRKTAYYKATGQVIYDEYYPRVSKQIIDKIDLLLANYYKLTEEELDYIINYDIKYRMGEALQKQFEVKE